MSRTALTLAFAYLAMPFAAAQPAAVPAKEKEKPTEPAEVRSYPYTNAVGEELQTALPQIWSRVPRKAGTAARPMPKISVNERTKTIIAVGSKSDLDVLAGIMAVLDGDASKAPNGGSFVLFRLKHASVAEANESLADLQLAQHVVVLPRAKSLVLVSPSDEVSNHVKQVVELLDKEVVPAKKPSASPTGTVAPKSASN